MMNKDLEAGGHVPFEDTNLAFASRDPGNP
jgi:hypothetical protein